MDAIEQEGQENIICQQVIEIMGIWTQMYRPFGGKRVYLYN